MGPKKEKSSKSPRPVEPQLPSKSLYIHIKEIGYLGQHGDAVKCNFTLDVSYMGEVLPLHPDCKNFLMCPCGPAEKLNHQYSIPIYYTDESSIIDFVGNPLIFCCYKTCKVDVPPDTPVSGRRSTKSIKSIKSAKKPKEIPMETVGIGYACFDLINFASSESYEFDNLFYLDPPEYPNCHGCYICDCDCFPNTIYIKLHIFTSEPLLTPEFLLDTTHLSITVECIYNLLEKMKDPEMNTTIGFLYPVKDEEEDTVIFNKPIVFSGGQLVKYEDLPLYKSWHHTTTMLGKGGRIGDLIHKQFDDVYDQFNVDIDDFDDVYSFNAKYRSILTPASLQFMRTEIESNHMCAIEMMINEHQTDSKKKAKEPKGDRYLGILDWSPLVYYGVTHGRFVVAMNEYDLDVQRQFCGHSRSSLVPKIQKKATPRSPKSPAIQANIAAKENEEPPKFRETPLLNENKKRVCLIVEIELRDPLVPEPALEDLLESIKLYIPNYVTPAGVEILATKAINAFNDTVELTIDKLNDIMEVSEQNELQSIDLSKFDECNKMYTIRLNLTERVKQLISVKYNLERKTQTTEDFKNLMVDVYNDLTEKIHAIINKREGFEDEYCKPGGFDKKDVKVLMAKEAQAIGYLDIAKELFRENIRDYPESVEPLADYIMLHFNNLDFEKADKYLQKLFLMSLCDLQGLLLMAYSFNQKDMLEDLEFFLYALTRFHPSFVEGWVILYLFYMARGFIPGQQVTFHNMIGYSYLTTDTYVHSQKDFYLEEFTEVTDIYLRATYLFIKMGLYDFAEMTFSNVNDNLTQIQRICLNSLLYFLKGDSEQAYHLISKVPLVGENEIYIRNLRGHYQYAEGNLSRAFREYELIYHTSTVEDTLINRLAALRAGLYCLAINQFQNAETYFVHLCKTMPTFFSWFGLGISLYRTNRLHYAEKAFIEANKINRFFGDVWLYFGLINLRQGNLCVFYACIENARKLRVMDGNLWIEVEQHADSHGKKIDSIYM